MTRPVVFLSGRMTGLTLDEMIRWRMELSDLIFSAGGEPTSPVSKLIDIDIDVVNDALPNSIPEISNADMFKADIASVDHSDIVFVNITQGLSIGTLFELGYSYAKKKIIIVLTTPEFADHPFVTEATEYVYTDREKAARALRKLLEDLTVPF